ncbi:DUF488 domain-containing protein [Streptomyces jeddahensis]|uniref:DUF488 domain-containing protein n=1 Tax=Streptomyces jeddahensis TaxID=1716141 RepID=A0A177HRQ9_9ACTN|nr:DUF488 domain-containing protein [Streptomyces jeddahensis]OAH13583.1 hypothetical protein STSP_29370 [Streptomyces jeddahensis]
MQLLTFGHGTAGAVEMTRLLHGAEVRRLVDVRTAPASRHNPDANRDAMSRWLPQAGLGYRWEKRLGGWRKARPDTPDTALRNRAFCGYAAHMRSPGFLAAIEDLLVEVAAERTTVMCAESVWWRCHRKMIADFLVLAREVEVLHLMHDGRLQRHIPSPEARVLPELRLLVYDAGQPPLPG